MAEEKYDPMKEVEKMMSQFRSDASSVASSSASAIAEALALPFKLPMAGIKAIGDAVAQAPGLPVPPGLPELKKALGLEKKEESSTSVDQPLERRGDVMYQ